MKDAGVFARTELESIGPPVPEQLAHTDVSTGFLCDLVLIQVALIAEASSNYLEVRL